MADDPNQLSMFEFRKRRPLRGDPSRIKVSLELRDEPDIDLYAQTLLAIARKMIAARAAVADDVTKPQPESDNSTPN